MILEVCCGSYDDGMAAYLAGAKRIELNSALSLGGLTPTLGTLKSLKRNTKLEIVCMVRNRAAGFCYNEEEYHVMLEDAKILLDHGADGIAFGFLTSDFMIDYSKTKAMVELIHSYGKTAVFHRAFDLVNNIDDAIHMLIELKVDRILTSGLCSTAIQGLNTIAYLEATYGKQIEILAGCGITADNISMFKEQEIKQIHSSCKSFNNDPTTENQNVSFSYRDDGYEIVSKENVINTLKAMNM